MGVTGKDISVRGEHNITRLICTHCTATYLIPTVFSCSSRCLSTLHAIYKLPPPLHPDQLVPCSSVCAVSMAASNWMPDGIDFVCVGGVIVTVIIYLYCGVNPELQLLLLFLSHIVFLSSCCSITRCTPSRNNLIVQTQFSKPNRDSAHSLLLLQLVVDRS